MEQSAVARPELPVVLFEDRSAWDRWLEQSHGTAPGVWLRLARKGASLRSLSYSEALDVALCHGWIDSQKRKFDEESWIQRFTPRAPRSVWSRVNVERVQALTEAGRMRPAGLRAVEQARADGRWDAAYDPQSRAVVPEDLRAALQHSPAAREFFQSLDGANRYAILFRVQTARRPETRARRIAGFIEMLERRERLHG